MTEDDYVEQKEYYDNYDDPDVPAIPFEEPPVDFSDEDYPFEDYNFDLDQQYKEIIWKS